MPHDNPEYFIVWYPNGPMDVE